MDPHIISGLDALVGLAHDKQLAADVCHNLDDLKLAFTIVKLKSCLVVFKEELFTSTDTAS